MNDNQLPAQQEQQQPVPQPLPEQPKVESKAGSLINEIRKGSTISRLSRAGISFISFGILASAAFAVFYPGTTDTTQITELPQTGSSEIQGELLEANNLLVNYPNEEWILVEKEANYLSLVYIPEDNTDFGTMPFIELSTVKYDSSGLDAATIDRILQAERLQLILQFGEYTGDFADYEVPDGTQYDYQALKYKDSMNSYTLLTTKTDIDGVLLDILITEPEQSGNYLEAIDRFVSEVQISKEFELPETGSDDLPELPENRNRNVLLSVLLINLSVGIALILISVLIRLYNKFKKKELAELIPH